MTVVFQSGYTLPGADQPLKHARIAHAGNWLSGGTAVASTTATGNYSADGPLNTLTIDRWKPSAGTSTWEYNHGSAAACNYCAIAAHTLGSANATFTVQYFNGSTWTNVSPSISPTDDSPIFVIFTSQTRQRWRLNITAGTPEIGVIKFGTALQMERGFYGGHTPTRMNRATEVIGNISGSGELLGRSKKRTTLRSGYAWENLTYAWVRANLDGPTGLIQSVETEPCFVAWRPGETQDVDYVMQAEPTPPQAQGLRDFFTFSMTGVAHSYE